MRRGTAAGPTSVRAVELSRRFAVANGEVTALAGSLTDGEWRLPCAREGRTVGQVIEHIAAGHLIAGGIVEALAFGLPLPVAARRTDVTGARYNARQAKQFGGHTREQGLRALRRNGRRVERFLAGLTDEQLARRTETPEGPVTTEQAVVGGLFGHLRSHRQAVRETLGR